MQRNLRTRTTSSLASLFVRKLHQRSQEGTIERLSSQGLPYQRIFRLARDKILICVNCKAFKEATLETDKLSSNITPILSKSDIKNKLEVKLNRLRHKNYNSDRCTNDDHEEDNNIRRQIRRAGKDRKPKIWDQWGNWSTCSVTCGIGKIVRWRHCISGSCSLGEKKAQLKTCTSAAC